MSRFYNRYGLTDFIDYMLRGYGGILEDEVILNKYLTFES